MSAGQRQDSDAVDERVFAVLNEIGIIDQLARTRAERRLPDGLRLSHFTVLNHFVRRGGAESPAQLARAFQVTRAAMTNTLSRLQARGLVDVVPADEDGRSKRVSITSAGRRAHRACVRAVAPDLERLQRAFGAPAFEQALPFLVELRQWLDADRD